MTKAKKTVSVLLAVLMLASVFVVSAVPASAADAAFISGNYAYTIHDNNQIEILAYGGTASSVNIPGTLDGLKVTRIGSEAFAENTHIESVSIPGSVKSIGNYAFYRCSNVKSISIPSGVTSIGQGAFRGCLSLRSINLPKGIKSIEPETFHSCSTLTSISIPGTVTYIGEYAFTWCENIQNMTVPSSVTFIGDSAFASCIGMRTIKILNKNCAIGNMAIGFFYDEDTDQMLSYPVSICAFSGSTAEEYARTNDFSFAKITTSVSVRKSASLYRKGTLQLKVTVTNGYGSTRYSSSNSSVASVTQSGKVTARKSGTATITVSNNGTKKYVKITVKNPSLTVKSKKIKVKRSFKIGIRGRIGKATFKSSNKKVATVSSSGKVKAKKKGSATITVTTNGIKLKCKVKVRK